MRKMVWAFLFPLALAQTGPYQKFCAQCHGERGQGKGAYPGFSALLKDRLFETEEGRRYLIQVVLYGWKAETLLMPGFAQLKDEEAAQALNQVLGLFGVKAFPFTPEEARKEREKPLTPEEVRRPSPPK